ncbi:MAG: ACT domain-containing protein [Peptoniphilaceae bacterium]|nr:ACT domain-containing protein [Peptoniphilaceae bacterium]MDY6019698.1 ACT domain-containing protein [Anaerococcus sp.]
MKAILTIIGMDRTGIVYKTSELLYKLDINILDISQTIMDDKFVAMFNIDLDSSKASFDEVCEAFDILAKEIGVDIKIQNEALFEKMHRI